jgi:hypothetical protein
MGRIRDVSSDASISQVLLSSQSGHDDETHLIRHCFLLLPSIFSLQLEILQPGFLHVCSRAILLWGALLMRPITTRHVSCSSLSSEDLQAIPDIVSDTAEDRLLVVLDMDSLTASLGRLNEQYSYTFDSF